MCIYMCVYIYIYIYIYISGLFNKVFLSKIFFFSECFPINLNSDMNEIGSSKILI